MLDPHWQFFIFPMFIPWNGSSVLGGPFPIACSPANLGVLGGGRIFQIGDILPYLGKLMMTLLIVTCHSHWDIICT